MRNLTNSCFKIPIAVILSLFLSTLISASAQDVIKVVKHEWNKPVGELETIGLLNNIGGSSYKGNISLQTWTCIDFVCGDYGYEGKEQYGFDGKGEVSNTQDGVALFKQVALTKALLGYFRTDVNETFQITAELSSDKSSLSVKIIPASLAADPTPLSISVNGEEISLSDDINGSNASIKIPGIFEVGESGSLTVGPLMAGGVAYGVQQQPAFTDSKLEQTQKVAVATGGSDLSVSMPGIYSISVDISNGLPSGYTVVKAQGDTRPLSISINGDKTLLSADIDGQSAEFSVSGTFDVASGKELTVGPVSVADELYGVATQPAFTASNDPQTQSLALVKGGNAATIGLKGSYSVRITVKDGIPTLCTISRARYTPVFTLNGSAIQAVDGTYSKTIFLSKGSTPTIIYDDIRLYISSDILADDAEAHIIRLSKNDSGCKVAADGSYELVFYPDRLQMQYTCKSWRDPDDTTPDKGLSSTLPQGVLDYSQNWQTFTPDNNDIFWSKKDGWEDGFSGFAGNATASAGILIGNGSFGAIIGGTPGYMSIKLNEKGLFEGKAEISDHKEFADFGEITIDAGRYGGDPLLQLDMSNGVYSCVGRAVDWQGLSTIAAQEWFASYPDQVIAGFISTQENNKLDFSIKLESKQGAGAESEQIADNIGDLYFSGKLSGELVSYACRVRVVAYDGQVSTSGGSIAVSNASSAMIVIAGMTDYDSSSKSFLSATTQLPDIVKSRATAAAQLGWQRLYKNHVEDHSALYNAMRLDLAGRDNSQCSDVLLDDYTAGNVSLGRQLQHENTVFNFGRYLMIASSRPAADGKGMDLPTNLQGMWAHDSKMWNCDIHTNINAEMNYWPAEVTNLSDNHLAFCNWIINLSNSDYWKWLAKEHLTKSRGASNLDGTEWTSLMAMNPFGGGTSYDTNNTYNDKYNAAQAWMCSHLIQHYLFTEDKAYLARALPVLWRACRFWVRNMDRKDEGGSYVYEIPYESSPEHAPSSTGPATAHTQQLVYYLFKHTLNLLEVMPLAEATAEKVADLKEKFTHLDKGLSYWSSGGKNYLREWKYANEFGQKNHRHLSHLVCMYPLDLAADAPDDIYESIINAMESRGLKCGDTDPAVWTTAWKVCLWARAHSSNAYTIYKSTIGHLTSSPAGTGLYSNLTSYNQCMQMEGNWGLTAGVAEMLLQSHAGYLDLLPALPHDWNDGKVTGLKAIGNHTVGITWSDGMAQRVDIVNHNGNPVSVRCPGIKEMYVYINGRRYTPTEKARGVEADGNDVLHFSDLSAGDKILLSRKYLSTGIDDIEGDIEEDSTDAPAEYFNLQGMRVASPQPGGLYIRRCGNKVDKIRF